MTKTWLNRPFLLLPNPQPCVLQEGKSGLWYWPSSCTQTLAVFAYRLSPTCSFFNPVPTFTSSQDVIADWGRVYFSWSSFQVWKIGGRWGIDLSSPSIISSINLSVLPSIIRPFLCLSISISNCTLVHPTILCQSVWMSSFLFIYSCVSYVGLLYVHLSFLPSVHQQAGCQSSVNRTTPTTRQFSRLSGVNSGWTFKYTIQKWTKLECVWPFIN